MIPEPSASFSQSALIIVPRLSRVILDFTSLAGFQSRQIRNRLPQSRTTLQRTTEQIIHTAANAMCCIREWPFKFVNGGNNKQTFPNLRNTKVSCLKNAVRYMVAQFFQLALNDSDYRFTTLRPCLFDVRNVLHDDVIRLQCSRNPKEFDKQRI